MFPAAGDDDRCARRYAVLFLVDRLRFRRAAGGRCVDLFLHPLSPAPGRPGLPPPYTPSSRKLEWFWTITPFFIFMVMFLWGAVVYVDAYRAPDEATRVYAIGKQWMWKFQHPEGQREINMLHVPVGRPMQILLTSEDVIHSFFVPEFRVHMDVLPEPLHVGLVRGDAAGDLSPLLLAVLRDEPCGHDRHGGGDGTGRLRELARTSTPKARWRWRGARSF